MFWGDKNISLFPKVFLEIVILYYCLQQVGRQRRLYPLSGYEKK
jgi:hypothetical protein